MGCGCELLVPIRICPPCSDTICGTTTGRIAGTAVPLTAGQGGFVLFVPAGTIQKAQVAHWPQAAQGAQIRSLQKKSAMQSAACEPDMSPHQWADTVLAVLSIQRLATIDRLVAWE